MARIDGRTVQFGHVLHGGGGDVYQAGGDIILGESAYRMPVPQQLPPDTAHFTGRAEALAALDEVGASGAGALTIVDGPAGVGKTALVVHWAHRMRSQFPDGVLHIDLCGYSPNVVPLTADQCLDALLRSLGVPPERLPGDTDAQAMLYRSLLAERRCLIVLDNAAGTDQVRPLVPGASGSVIVVTSRSRLSGLVARDGARRVTLAHLPPVDAVELLARVVGAERVAQEPEAACSLARRCTYLPLALRIVGQRIATRPHSRLRDVLDELDGQRQPLDALSADDGSVEVRSALSWSYHSLPADAAVLFRRLGLHPGPEISTAAAAVLASLSLERTQRVLRSLASVHLIEQIHRDRFRLHDLVRSYARERTAEEEPASTRGAALRRIADWYLRTADAADRILNPARAHVPLTHPEPDVHPLAFEVPEQALAWYERERSNLVAVTRQAADNGNHVLAWKIPVVMLGFFDLRKHWRDWIQACQIGLSAAQRIDDQYGQAWILNSLGIAYYDLRKFDAAVGCYEQALRLCDQIGERWGQAWTLHNLGNFYRGRHEFDRARGYYVDALDLFTTVGDRWGEAWTVHNLGIVDRARGRCAEARERNERALVIFRDLGDSWGEGWALHNLGSTCRELGLFTEAARFYEQAIAVRRRVGDRQGEACTLRSLSHILAVIRPASADQAERVRDFLYQSWAIFVELGDPRAADVYAALGAVQPSADARTG